MKAAPSEKYEPMSDEILKECDKKKQKDYGFHLGILEVVDVSGCCKA